MTVLGELHVVGVIFHVLVSFKDALVTDIHVVVECYSLMVSVRGKLKVS